MVAHLYNACIGSTDYECLNQGEDSLQTVICDTSYTGIMYNYITDCKNFVLVIKKQTLLQSRKILGGLEFQS